MTRPAAPGGAGAVATAPEGITKPATGGTHSAAPAPSPDSPSSALAALDGVRVVERPLPRAPEVLAFVMHGLDSYALVAAGPLVLVRRFDPDRVWRLLAECADLAGACAVLRAHVEAWLAARDALAALGLPHGRHRPAE